MRGSINIRAEVVEEWKKDCGQRGNNRNIGTLNISYLCKGTRFPRIPRYNNTCNWERSPSRKHSDHTESEQRNILQYLETVHMDLHAFIIILVVIIIITLNHR